MFKDAKYLLAFIPTSFGFLAIEWAGLWSYSALIIGFVLIPIFEQFTPQSKKNLTPEEESSKLVNRFFDILLYLNIPLLYGLLFFYFARLAGGGLETYEIVGLTIGSGITVGSLGINVGHELGHRQTWYEQLMSKILLMSALYMHFFIEHNRGHHLRVATPEDPATSRYGENVYSFYLRSMFFSYTHAWHLENERLRRIGKPAFHWQNEMIWYHLIQALYLLTVGLVFGWYMILFAVIAAFIGILQLESVNYIEHYGLVRKKLASGHYEKVQPHHSWNSNHELGRIILYELTRHSDHHYKATRKYQVLRHFDESPQLPYDYSTSILMAMIPPLWFKVMNKRVRALEG